MQVVNGEELCDLLHWEWSDALEAISWAMPFLECGRRNSPRTWRFTIGHTIRWCGFVSQAFKVHAPLALVPELRRMREAAGLPLDTPIGFVPFKKGRGLGPRGGHIG
jgi:hypothetical protein